MFLRAYGLRSKDPEERPMTVDTVFDLASLTKVVATAPSIHLLAEQGKIKLSAPVARYLPAFGAKGKEAITVEQLLLHTGGLVADNPLTDYRGGRAEALGRIDALAPAHDPGSAFEYSDVGYIVLGELVEAVSGQPLDVFAREHLFAPLGMDDTAYDPGAALLARAAPTEPRDGAMLEGEVHDPRAHLLGGVAGHAGLFSTAADLARFAAMLLDKGKPGPGSPARVLAPSTLRAMTTPRDLPDGAKRTLGWDVRPGLAGGPGGYGHTGFTGTSLWIDPASDTAIIVLTSRLYPDGKGDPRRLRREVVAAAARRARGATAAPRATGKVLTGIDVLERDGFARFRGHRVGLVTNASGVDRSGARTADVLRAAPGVTLVALFSPEHGSCAAGADGAGWATSATSARGCRSTASTASARGRRPSSSATSTCSSSISRTPARASSRTRPRWATCSRRRRSGASRSSSSIGPTPSAAPRWRGRSSSPGARRSSATTPSPSGTGSRWASSPCSSTASGGSAPTSRSCASRAGAAAISSTRPGCPG